MAMGSRQPAPAPSSSRRTAVSTALAVQSAEQLHPPSKTGARAAPPERAASPSGNAGWSRPAKDPARTGSTKLARPLRCRLRVRASGAASAASTSVSAVLCGFKRGIVCSPVACAARPPRSPAGQNCRSPAPLRRGRQSCPPRSSPRDRIRGGPARTTSPGPSSRISPSGISRQPKRSVASSSTSSSSSSPADWRRPGASRFLPSVTDAGTPRLQAARVTCTSSATSMIHVRASERS